MRNLNYRDVKSKFVLVAGILFGTVGLYSCHTSDLNLTPTPPGTSCTATTNLQYNNSNCPVTGGCTLAFTCPLTASKNLSSFQKITNYVSQIFKAATPVTLEISRLTINQPALLQASAGDAPTNWYNTAVSCTQDGETVTCSDFLPIASDFTIQGTLGDLDLTLNMTVQNSISPATDCGTAMCGQMGTTVQRMFDCSQRVTNFAGNGNNDGTVNPFVPGTPDPNWFLVFSPGTAINQCFWLSPVLESGNLSLGDGTNQYDSLGNPMSNYTGGRLLWSGVSSASMTFETVNNNGTPPTGYDNYPYTNNTTFATISGLPNVLTSTVCQTGSDPVRLSEAAYIWQMPSYPMIMTLAGGTGSGGSYCVSNPGNLAFCNPDGFRAINNNPPIPGFDEIIWSSSVRNANFAWVFNDVGSSSGSVGFGGSFRVRCVSAAW